MYPPGLRGGRPRQRRLGGHFWPPAEFVHTGEVRKSTHGQQADRKPANPAHRAGGRPYEISTLRRPDHAQVRRRLPCTRLPKVALPGAAYPAPPARGRKGRDRAAAIQVRRGLPYTGQAAAPQPGRGLDWRRLPPTRLPSRGRPALGKSRRRTAYPQQIVTTRLLYCLQDRFAQLSRLQRI